MSGELRMISPTSGNVDCTDVPGVRGDKIQVGMPVADGHEHQLPDLFLLTGATASSGFGVRDRR